MQNPKGYARYNDDFDRLRVVVDLIYSEERQLWSGLHSKGCSSYNRGHIIRLQVHCAHKTNCTARQYSVQSETVCCFTVLSPLQLDTLFYANRGIRDCLSTMEYSLPWSGSFQSINTTMLPQVQTYVCIQIVKSFLCLIVFKNQNRASSQSSA